MFIVRVLLTKVLHNIVVSHYLLFIYYYFLFFISQGWYIVTYALGIFHLNLFIAFLSPKIDPAMSDFEGILTFQILLSTKVQELKLMSYQ